MTTEWAVDVPKNLWLGSFFLLGTFATFLRRFIVSQKITENLIVEIQIPGDLLLIVPPHRR